MIRWLKKKLGYHVCERFSQWHEHWRIIGRRVWRVQKRRCVECGREFQRRLEQY